MLTRITKRQAKELFAAGKVVNFCPCKMRAGPPFSMDCPIYPTEHIESAKRYDPAVRGEVSPLWKGSLTETAWHLAYNNWAFYNANYECGYYAHYYVQS